MKLSWKKKNNKRTVKAACNYLDLDLPFQQLEKPRRDDDENKNKERDRFVVKEETGPNKPLVPDDSLEDPHIQQLAGDFLAQGNKLAEDGKYREALGKWEAAINLRPERAVFHEQKAQVLIEIGDAWNILKAATRATELERLWAEAWTTLGRAQLNFGEPDNAIQSFDKVLAIEPDSKDARSDQQTALHLVKKRKHLHSSGLSSRENRFVVGEVKTRDGLWKAYA